MIASGRGCTFGRQLASAPIRNRDWFRKSCTDRRQNLRPIFARNFLARVARVRGARPRLSRRLLRMWAGLRLSIPRPQICMPAPVAVLSISWIYPDNEESLRPRAREGLYQPAAEPSPRSPSIAPMPVDAHRTRGVLLHFARSENRLPPANRWSSRLAATLLADTSLRRRSLARRHCSGEVRLYPRPVICTPKKPSCVFCPLNGDCARRPCYQETFPLKCLKIRALRRARPFVVTRAMNLLGPARPKKACLWRS